MSQGSPSLGFLVAANPQEREAGRKYSRLFPAGRVQLLLSKPPDLSDLSAAKVGVAEFGPVEIRAAEVGADEVGAAEVGAAEVGAAEVGAAEIGAAEVGPDEVGNAA